MPWAGGQERLFHLGPEEFRVQEGSPEGGAEGCTAHGRLSAGRATAPSHSEKGLRPRKFWLWVLPQVQVQGLPLNHRRPEVRQV